MSVVIAIVLTLIFVIVLITGGRLEGHTSSFHKEGLKSLSFEQIPDVLCEVVGGPSSKETMLPSELTPSTPQSLTIFWARASA